MSATTPDNYDITAKQNATNERSAAARLDRQTEDRLYRLYRDYFQTAENERRWNLWDDLPWDDVRTDPDPALAEAVTRAYQEELFLPDFSSKVLAALRSSRGRAWFITRWSYEESKHLLALTEWLTRSGAFPVEELRSQSDELLLHYTWDLPYADSPAVLADLLLWELKEVARYQALQTLAEKAEDPALIGLCAFILRDEEAHRAFLRQSLAIIAETYPDRVEDAVRRIAATVSPEDDGAESVAALLSELNLLPAGE